MFLPFQHHQLDRHSEMGIYLAKGCYSVIFRESTKTKRKKYISFGSSFCWSLHEGFFTPAAGGGGGAAIFLPNYFICVSSKKKCLYIFYYKFIFTSHS